MALKHTHSVGPTPVNTLAAKIQQRPRVWPSAHHNRHVLCLRATCHTCTYVGYTDSSSVSIDLHSVWISSPLHTVWLLEALRKEALLQLVFFSARSVSAANIQSLGSRVS